METNKHLIKFENFSEYETFLNSDEFVTPNVSLIKSEGNKLYYKPLPTLECGFYTLKCGDLYLNDDVINSETKQRTLTSGEISSKNIFYSAKDNALISYSSGFGFVNGVCNTKNPDDGYNTFKYRNGDEPGTLKIMSQKGTTTNEPELNNGRYFKENNGVLDFVMEEENASNFIIEPVTELPVSMNFANDEEGAYASLWTPVALKLPEDVVAYGCVIKNGVLSLTLIDGNVIPKNTGVLLNNVNAKANYVAKLSITDEVGEPIKGNTFEGTYITCKNVNPGEYYSLGKKDGKVALYKYTGANLSAFRARTKCI